MHLGKINSGILALFPAILIDLQNISLFTMALKGSLGCTPMARTALAKREKNRNRELLHSPVFYLEL